MRTRLCLRIDTAAGCGSLRSSAGYWSGLHKVLWSQLLHRSGDTYKGKEDAAVKASGKWRRLAYLDYVN